MWGEHFLSLWRGVANRLQRTLLSQRAASAKWVMEELLHRQAQPWLLLSLLISLLLSPLTPNVDQIP